MTDDQEWLRASEVAKIFHVHVNTVKRLPPKDLPYLRFGSRGDRLYNYKDIEEYIRVRTVK